MSHWSIHQRARNVGTKAKPLFVTIWVGKDENGQRRWLVNDKPDPTTEDGPVFSVQGGPASFGRHPTSLRAAIRQFKNP